MINSNNGHRVALVKCSSYHDGEVYSAVRTGFSLLGGISQYLSKGENIVIKPNVLYGTAPETCVCTHPAVLRAVGKLLLEAGINVSCGDSSAFGGCEANMKRAGLKKVADELGIKLADFDEGRVVVNDDAVIDRRFVIANGVLDADGLVSISKLKTHEFTVFTGAIKNQFGCIPGVLKNQLHARFPNPQDFSTMLVDLNMAVKPRLFIMDAVIAMEGNGPRGGEPRQLDVLLFSSDPVALDAVACKIINLSTELVPTFEPGEKAGLGTYNYDNIQLVGDNIEEFIRIDFKVVRKKRVPVPVKPTGTGIKTRIRSKLSAIVRERICQRPVIDKTKCTRCGICVNSCPVEPKALDWRRQDKKKPPVHNYERCIRCFCCQEFCPEGAISVRTPLLSGILSRLYALLMSLSG